MLQELQHPSIIRQYFTFQDKANLYYVFEYAGKGSLTKIINRLNMGDNKMPLELVKLYAAEIILALHAMHSKNIIHRDIKPENILVADDWHLKLVSTSHFINMLDRSILEMPSNWIKLILTQIKTKMRSKYSRSGRLHL